MDGAWQSLERDARWTVKDDPHQMIHGGPVPMLITVFRDRMRKEVCLEDVPSAVQKRKEHQVNATQQPKGSSKNKLRRTLEKEIPYERIPFHERPLYSEAEQKECESWKQYDSCEILSLEERPKIMEGKPERVLPSRYVCRNKRAGLVDSEGHALPTNAKARLCLRGHLCPDSKSGQLQVDAPTVERVSTMVFLHYVVCAGWLNNWIRGDISNAFLRALLRKARRCT